VFSKGAHGSVVCLYAAACVTLGAAAPYLMA